MKGSNRELLGILASVEPFPLTQLLSLLQADNYSEPCSSLQTALTLLMSSSVSSSSSASIRSVRRISRSVNRPLPDLCKQRQCCQGKPVYSSTSSCIPTHAALLMAVLDVVITDGIESHCSQPQPTC